MIFIVTFLMRVASAMKDGLSDRAAFINPHQGNPTKIDRVGWVPWHIFGWLARDIPILILYYYEFIEWNVEPKLFVVLGLLALGHWISHVVIYSLAVNYAHWFDWGGDY